MIDGVVVGVRADFRRNLIGVLPTSCDNTWTHANTAGTVSAVTGVTVIVDAVVMPSPTRLL